MEIEATEREFSCSSSTSSAAHITGNKVEGGGKVTSKKMGRHQQQQFKNIQACGVSSQ
jgi:hypothetical protein